MSGAPAAMRWSGASAGADEAAPAALGRDARIDAAKAVAIVMVVLGHAKGVPQTYTVLAYSFHVPLFFFLSGWVLEAHGSARSYGQSLLRLARVLLVPYLCFFLLGYGYWLLTRNIGEKALRWGSQPWWEPLGGLFTGIGPRLYVHPAIWFLLALFVTTAVYIGWRRYWRAGAISLAMLVLAWMWIGSFPDYGIRLPFALDILPVSLFFFAAGAAAAGALRLPQSRWGNLLLALALAAPWLWLALGNGRVDINQLEFGESHAKFFAASGLGIAGVLCGARLLQRWNVVQWIGRNTLLLLCTHILVFFVLSGVASLAGWFAGGARPGLGWALLVTALALCLSLPLHWIFMKLAPWAIGARRPQHRERK